MWDSIGIINALVIVLCLLVLGIRLAARFSPQKRLWDLLLPFLHLSDGIALLFIVGCLGLFLNGSLDQSSPQQIKITVLAVEEEPFRPSRWWPAGHAKILVQILDVTEETIQLNGRLLNTVLPNQVFSISIHEGFLGMRWVELNSFHSDRKATLKLLADHAKDDPLIQKWKILDALNATRLNEAFDEAVHYLDQEDNDLDFAITIAWHAGGPAVGRPEIAVKLLEPLVAKHRNYKLYCSYASYLTKTGHLDKSIQYLTAATAIDPNESDAYYMLGHTYRKAGRRDESLAAFRKFIQLNPSHADIVRPYL